MSKRTLKGLIVLNVALLMALGAAVLTPRAAEAQLGGQRAGDYVLVAAKRAGGGGGNTVYITDLNNAVMLAVESDCRGTRGSLRTVAYRILANDFAGAGGGGRQSR